MNVPVIDPVTCSTCRACVGICPVGAVRQLRREVEVDYGACVSCGLCVQNCPTGAMTFPEREVEAAPAREKVSTPAHLGGRFDLVVCGAGIAGLSTALGALKEDPGMEVLVLDKKRIIGEDANSSAGTWSFTLDMLPLDGDERERVVLQRFTGFGLGTRKSWTVIRTDEPYLETLDLPALLKVLAKKLVAMGARIETNTFVESIKREDGGFTLTAVSKGVAYDIRTRLFADASGVDTRPSRDLGMHLSWKPEVLGVGAEYEMGWRGEQETAWIIPIQYLGLGYAWVFPIGTGLARVGVAGLLSAFQERGLKLQEVLDTFIEEHPLIRENTAPDSSRLAYKCGAYPIAGIAEDIVTEGALRVGDAAAQANPLLGEGIYYCIKNGLFAGRTLARAREGTEEELKPYRDFVLSYAQRFEEDKLGFRLDFDAIIRKLNENPDLLSPKEKRVLLEYMMPVKPDWKTRIAISKKLLGTKKTLQVFGSVMKRMALGK
ncbi:MAG: 4Fe-4S dicluster domain-containing protein [Euryarchaeota archaeon]|nr:4Fe-4S dicluster domain-containing protein [Euryarchaeota archaeon]